MTVRLPRLHLLGGALVATVTALASARGEAQRAPQGAAGCANPANRVVAENCKPGNPSTEWDINGSGDPRIQGFATDISVNAGEAISFKIGSDSPKYRIDIYRLGYYGGARARLVATVRPAVPLPQTQPACLTDESVRLYDCGNWAVSASWPVPRDAISGIYIARLVREDDTTTSWRPDDVGRGRGRGRSDAPEAGPHVYGALGLGRLANALKEPRASHIYFVVRDDVTYTTGLDNDRRGALIKNHKVFLSVGHDEYWSGPQRANVEAARDAGVHLAFFSGNDVFWKIRWEPGTDPAHSPYRTLVTYKETHANAKIDPLLNVWTGTWRDARAINPEGPKPENALKGTIFTVNAWRNDPLIVPAEFAKLRFWRQTEVAQLKSGDSAVLGSGILGHEWNEDLDNGFRPAGLIRMSTTTVNNVPYIQDYGTVYAAGTATHHLTLYRASSGALVFSAGTVQWAWGLDPNHDTETGIPPERANSSDIRVGVDLKGGVRAIQQATLNVLADMGAQPTTIQPGLIKTTASSDKTSPASRVDPGGSRAIANGLLEISGTASDAGGGVVGAVEGSSDGGTTWHPADGTTRWTYRWKPPSSANPTIRTRAVDDSGNLEAVAPGSTQSLARERGEK